MALPLSWRRRARVIPTLPVRGGEAHAATEAKASRQTGEIRASYLGQAGLAGRPATSLR